MGKRKAGVNDTRALEEIAGALKAIIERDDKRGLETIGLESARREIEWAARRNRSSLSARGE